MSSVTRAGRQARHAAVQGRTASRIFTSSHSRMPYPRCRKTRKPRPEEYIATVVLRKVRLIPVSSGCPARRPSTVPRICVGVRCSRRRNARVLRCRGVSSAGAFITQPMPSKSLSRSEYTNGMPRAAYSRFFERLDTGDAVAVAPEAGDAHVAPFEFGVERRAERGR